MSDEYPQESHIKMKMQSFIKSIRIKQKSHINYTINQITDYVNNTNLKLKMEAMERPNNTEMAKETAQDALTTTRKSIFTFYNIPVGGGTKRKRKRRKRKRRKTKRKKTKRRR